MLQYLNAVSDILRSFKVDWEFSPGKHVQLYGWCPASWALNNRERLFN
jgi:hypothetical protein